MDINSVSIIGRMTRDMDYAFTSTGVAIGKISLAVNHMKKDEVSFLDVKVFGKLADNLKPYLLKGKQIGVTGFLKQERWEKDGQKFSRVIINADSIELLGGNSNGNSNNNSSYGDNGYGAESNGYGYGN